MVDRIKSAQVISQVETTATPLEKVTKVSSQVEHTIYDRMSMTQMFAQVEYEEPPLPNYEFQYFLMG